MKPSKVKIVVEYNNQIEKKAYNLRNINSNIFNKEEIPRKITGFINPNSQKMIKPQSILRIMDQSKNSSISLCNNSTENLKTSKLFFLNRISLILTDIFTKKEIDFNIVKNLRKYELKILLTIISKKFNKIFTIDYDQIPLGDLKEKFLIIFQALQMEGSYKRIEENNKFVFKFTYKNLKYKFLQKNNLPDNSKNELFFLKFFFLKIFEEKNIEFKKIFPKNSKQIVWQSLNNNFFHLIFQSKEFKEKFFQYTQNNFQDDYEKLILRKFDKFLNKYDKSLKKVSTSAMIKDFCLNLNKNRRTKFPWTNIEITTALKNFKCNIEKILVKSTQ